MRWFRAGGWLCWVSWGRSIRCMRRLGDKRNKYLTSLIKSSRLLIDSFQQRDLFASARAAMATVWGECPHFIWLGQAVRSRNWLGITLPNRAGNMSSW